MILFSCVALDQNVCVAQTFETELDEMGGVVAEITNRADRCAGNADVREEPQRRSAVRG